MTDRLMFIADVVPLVSCLTNENTTYYSTGLGDLPVGSCGVYCFT